MLIDILIKFL